MARNLEFTEGEIYHIFNRGVDKRIIFQDEKDFARFLECMLLFNNTEPIGSIYESHFNKKKERFGHGVSKTRLVEFVCYCLNPNHFHFVLKQFNRPSEYKRFANESLEWILENKENAEFLLEE